MASQSQTVKTTVHEEIRRWAEEHGGKPARVRGTADGGGGVLRIDFPGGAGEDDLEPISWDEWFEIFAIATTWPRSTRSRRPVARTARSSSWSAATTNARAGSRVRSAATP